MNIISTYRYYIIRKRINIFFEKQQCLNNTNILNQPYILLYNTFNEGNISSHSKAPFTTLFDIFSFKFSPTRGPLKLFLSSLSCMKLSNVFHNLKIVVKCSDPMIPHTATPDQYNIDRNLVIIIQLIIISLINLSKCAHFCPCFFDLQTV